MVLVRRLTASSLFYYFWVHYTGHWTGLIDGAALGIVYQYDIRGNGRTGKGEDKKHPKANRCLRERDPGDGPACIENTQYPLLDLM